jgi:hypothetical protein
VKGTTHYATPRYMVFSSALLPLPTYIRVFPLVSVLEHFQSILPYVMCLDSAVVKVAGLYVGLVFYINVGNVG